MADPNRNLQEDMAAEAYDDVQEQPPPVAEVVMETDAEYDEEDDPSEGATTLMRELRMQTQRMQELSDQSSDNPPENQPELDRIAQLEATIFSLRARLAATRPLAPVRPPPPAVPQPSAATPDPSLAQYLQELTRTQRELTATVTAMNTAATTPGATPNTRPDSAQPKMGHLVQVDGKWFAKLGGVPRSDWSGLSKPSQHASGGQYRSLDKTKSYKISEQLTALDPKWQKKHKLTTLQQHIVKQLVKTGMEQHCYLPHPYKPNEVINVVKHPHIVSRDLDFIRKECTKQARAYDDWDRENVEYARDLLLDSIHPSLHPTVAGINDEDDPFLVTWIKVVREWSILTREKAEAVRAQIETCDIRNFHGMDVAQAVDYLRPLCDGLYETREYDPIKLIDFVRTLFNAFPADSPYHLRWWTDLDQDIVTPLEDKYQDLKLKGGTGACEIEDHFQQQTKIGGPDAGLDYGSILQRLKEKYQSYLNRKRWPAASSPKDKRAPNVAFGAASVNQATTDPVQCQPVDTPLTRAEVYALLQDFSSVGKPRKPREPRDKSNDTCNRCGQKGHWARDPACPMKATKPNQSGSGSKPPDTAPSDRTPNWKYVAPTSGSPDVVTKEGKTWKWCAKCNRGKGRWTTTHTTADHRKGQGKTAPTVNQVTLADTPSYHPAAWYTPVDSTVSLSTLWTALSRSIPCDVGCLFREYYTPLLLGYLLCLLTVHSATILSGLTTGATWIQRGLPLVWPFLSQLYSLVGVAPLVWLLPLFALLAVPRSPPDHSKPCPRWLRRRRAQAHHRWIRRARKPKRASIRDYGYNKRYPLPLRSRSCFYSKAPTLDQQTLLSDMGKWFREGRHKKSGHKRPMQFTSGSTFRRKGDQLRRHSRRANRRQKPEPRVYRPIPMPPQVHHFTNGSRVRFPKPSLNTKTRECWCCGAFGHQHRQCPDNPESPQFRPPNKPHQRSAKDPLGKPCHQARTRHRRYPHPPVYYADSGGRMHTAPHGPPPSKVHTPDEYPTYYCQPTHTHSIDRCIDRDLNCLCVYPVDCPYLICSKDLSDETSVRSQTTTESSHSEELCMDGGQCVCRYPVECPYLVKADRAYFEDLVPGTDITPSELQRRKAEAAEFFAMPTQNELRQASSLQYDETVAFHAAVEDHFVAAALMAPYKARAEMSEHDSFTIVWDSGASRCVTNNLDDFISPPRSPGLLKTLSGMASGMRIKGEGIVEWVVMDEFGRPRTLRLPCLYCPSSPVKLLATTILLRTYPEEEVNLNEQAATLTGVKGDATRAPVKAWINPVNGIPECTAYRIKGLEQAALSLNTIANEVNPRNLNLSDAEKELLRWHQRLGHLDFQKIQFLLRSGVLATTQTSRALQQRAAKLRHPPKCAACLYGKSHARGPKSKSSAVRDQPSPVLKQDRLLPGQTVAVDHFVTSAKGVTLTGRGGANAPGFSGGCVMVDMASKYIHVECQQHLNTHETLNALKNFERVALDHGVIPREYISDQGSAFTSKAFRDHLSEYKQIISFVGTAAHHHNAVAERAIRTLISITRTMMIHSSMWWPGVADQTLWPLAVQYAAYVYNRVPDRDTGLSPLDIFSGTRQPQRRLLDMHVWGSPAYLLDKRIADGKKLPHFQPKSERTMFVGVSPNHLAGTPRVLNLRTRAITHPYHLVVDDWFNTVTSTIDEIPDFESPEWRNLFGEGTSQYHHIEDGSWMEEPPPLEPSDERMLERREQIAGGLHQQYQPQDDPWPYPEETLSNPFYEHMNPQPHESQAPDDHARAPAPTRTGSLTHHQRENSPGPMNSPDTSYPSNAGYRTPPPRFKLPDTTMTLPQEPTHVPPATPTTPAPRIPGLSTPATILSNKRARKRPKYFAEGNHAPIYMVKGNFSVQANNVIINDTTYQFHPAQFWWLFAETTPEEYAAFKASPSDPDTMTLQQALADTKHYDKWIEALEKEIRALEEHGVWEEVRWEDAQGEVIPSHFVMKIKRRPDGTLEKFKSRLVVAGNRMDSYDFETFAPVAAWSTVRMIMILALAWGWYTCTCDYANAFIHSLLPASTPVWIRLPKGYTSEVAGRTCLKLKKSLYGTNFAPKLWTDTLKAALLAYGLTQSTVDPCLFSKPGVMIASYVDDLFCAFKDPSERDRFLKSMKEQGFTLTMSDEADSFLGIKFDRLSDDKFHLTQPALIDKIIEATNMQGCNRVATPAVPGTPLGKDKSGPLMTDTWSYKSVCGMLLYLSNNSRPDICYAVSQVCRFSHEPRQSHAAAVKRIVRYLSGTKDKGTYFQPTKALTVDCMSDADFCGLYKNDAMEDTDSAKSRMGYVIKLAGCLLECKSQLISSVCLATAEAEYYALSHCLRALIPIRRTLEDLVKTLGLSQEISATISSSAYTDNTACLTIARDHRLTQRTRYYHAQYHHFWQHVDNGTVVPKPIETALMDADYFTKGMPKAGFESNRLRVQGW